MGVWGLRLFYTLSSEWVGRGGRGRAVLALAGCLFMWVFFWVGILC